MAFYVIIKISLPSQKILCRQNSFILPSQFLKSIVHWLILTCFEEVWKCLWLTSWHPPGLWSWQSQGFQFARDIGEVRHTCIIIIGLETFTWPQYNLSPVQLSLAGAARPALRPRLEVIQLYPLILSRPEVHTIGIMKKLFLLSHLFCRCFSSMSRRCWSSLCCLMLALGMLSILRKHYIFLISICWKGCSLIETTPNNF